ncbi:MAG: M3 family metallopeptidase [Vulcanimicrobiaceae bacterium]
MTTLPSRFAASLARACGLVALALTARGTASAAPPPMASPPPGPAATLDFSTDASAIAARCRSAIADAQTRADSIVRVPTGARSFATIVRPLEDLSADLSDGLVAESFLGNVSTQRPVRDASLACQNAQSDFMTALTARPDLYRAVAAVATDSAVLSDPDRKLVDLWLVSLRRSGAGLRPSERKRFIAQSQQLAQLQTAYGANLGNDTTTIRLERAALAGLPSDVIATFKRDGETYVVPVNESVAPTFMENASDPHARETYYLADGTIAPKNVELLRRAIALRASLAGILGYPNWAAYVLDDRMASTPAHVTSFLDSLDAKLLPRARTEIARLAALKARDLGRGSATMEPWDVAYYDNALRRTEYAVDTNVVKQYFPVEHVERAVFDIYAKLLGVSFAMRPAPNVWALGVTQWSVTDTASGRYVGDFYLDLFPRDGKYSHFASFPLLPNRRLPDGKVRPPLDAIVGNWPVAAPGKPALLSHGDVETFFHEFGHDMATLLATAPYETLSSGFRQDFVEAPSQMLENWVWDPQILKELSSNVVTGAPLPDATIEKMRAARYVDNAYYTTRQIMLASIDMAYHTAGPHVDTTAVWAEKARALTPIPLAPGVHPEASFGHLMGGYDAGYYGYLWSKVYAQDLFTAFAANGLENAAIGARYRREILEPAREREPDAEVRAFLGRAMDPTAFYKEFDSAR